MFGQRGTALSAGQREDFRRRQATQRQRAEQARQRYQQSGPTFYLRPNSFSDLTFKEFAARLDKIFLKIILRCLRNSLFSGTQEWASSEESEWISQPLDICYCVVSVEFIEL